VEFDYSPKLKEAMAEIKAILTKHDIAGHVLLHEPGFSEYLLAISPSWSLLKQHIDGDGVGVQIRSKLEDFGCDVEAQHRANEATVNLVHHFAKMLMMDAGIFAGLYDKLEDHWDIETGVGVHTPHRDH